MNRQEWAEKFRGKATSSTFGADGDYTPTTTAFTAIEGERHTRRRVSRHGIDFESPDTSANRSPASMVSQMAAWATGRPVSSAAGDVEDDEISAVEAEIQTNIQREGLLATDPPISGGNDSTIANVASAVASPVMAVENLVSPVSTPIVQRPMTPPAARPAPAAPILHPATAGLLGAPSGTKDLLIAGGIGIALLGGWYLWNREGK